MTPRQLDLAYEYCEKVSADDLLDYLGLAADASADEARAALKARRRKMQGMQSNPKFRDEARLLIRNFQALDAVLGEPANHVRDMARRRESSHLPILEMTIRGVLTGGPLTSEQEAYLRTNATELGVSAASFDVLLRRLQVETHGAQRPPRAATPAPAPLAPEPPLVRPADEGETTLLDIGDLTTGGSPGSMGSFEIGDMDAIDLGDRAGASTDSPPRSRTHRPVRPERPPNLSGAAKAGASTRADPRQPAYPAEPHSGRDSRDQLGLRPSSGGSTPVRLDAPHDAPSLTSAATAPPVRMRAIVPGSGDDPSTAKRPAPPRSYDDAFPGGMEVVGPTTHHLELLGRRPATVDVQVRLLGELPVAARVVSDDPWVSVDPERLSPTRRDHHVTITVHPDKMFNDEDSTTVRLFNDLGEQVEVVISARRTVNWSGLFIGVFAVVGVAALAAAAWWLSGLFMPSTAQFLVVNVDPTSEAILLDGVQIGSGQSARIDQPATGARKLTVVQNNFETYQATIELSSGEPKMYTAPLVLLPMKWEPRPGAPQGSAADTSSLVAVTERMEKCVGRTPRSHPAYHVDVKIKVRQNGAAGNVRLVGRDLIPKPVGECLRRNGATVDVGGVEGGSWAEVILQVDYPPPLAPLGPSSPSSPGPSTPPSTGPAPSSPPPPGGPQ